MENNKLLIAFVGMPGSGKTEATSFLHQKGFPFVRFGDVTDAGLKEQGLSFTPENDQKFREGIRKELGMAAYAIKSLPAIEQALQNHQMVILDGLYSWAEYTYLKEKYEGLLLIHVYAQPSIRYERLTKRPVRPWSREESRKRDFSEIEKIDKGGPIAIADYLIENNGDDLRVLHEKVTSLLKMIGVTV